ncbi:MAG: helix-turn-helix transcriptional regulator, partial [Oscillospiraceae bacterium]|nr:helix-turn-helix transcriptional regulator [Oscillospiraceae bacterium]
MTIKELREKYNLTQSALARSLGVSSNAISGIEAGRIKLSPKMSARIKEVYGEELTSAAPEKAAEATAATPEKKTTTKKAAEAEAAPALEKKDDVESAVDEKAAEVATPAAPAPEKKP